MYEDELIATYRNLHTATKNMADAAKSSDWTRFSDMERESVIILTQIENTFKLERLSVAAKATIATEVQAILDLQNQIHEHADAWRRIQTQQQQSDAMSAKLNNAYS